MSDNRIAFHFVPSETISAQVREILRGFDGVSPTVSVTEISGGYKITITDKDGDHTFNLMNGVDGQDGTNGTDGQNGVNGADGKDWIPTAAELDGIAQNAAAKLQPTISELSDACGTAMTEQEVGDIIGS